MLCPDLLGPLDWQRDRVRWAWDATPPLRLRQSLVANAVGGPSLGGDSLRVVYMYMYIDLPSGPRGELDLIPTAWESTPPTHTPYLPLSFLHILPAAHPPVDSEFVS